MDFTKRLNKSTGVVEAIAVVQATVEAIETNSKTNSNGKAYGFINARVNGDLLTGVAYQKTADAYTNKPEAGDVVTMEALATDVANGINKNWSLALPTASSVSKDDQDAAKAFLAQS